MSRKLQNRFRILRDGREVEVLHIFAKTTHKGYPRQAAKVSDRLTGEIFEVWYTQFVEPYREKWVRERREAGLQLWGLKSGPATLQRVDLAQQYAFQKDGLVQVRYFAGTAKGGTNADDPERLGLARILNKEKKPGPKKKVFTFDGKYVGAEHVSLYQVRLEDRTVCLVEDHDLIGWAGPGYSDTWRRTHLEERVPAREDEKLLVQNLRRYIARFPNYHLTMEELALLGIVPIEEKREQPPGAQAPISQEEWLRGTGDHDDRHEGQGDLAT